MEKILENPDGIKKAEIVAGIPSYNEADAIEFVVSQVDEGLSRHFGRMDTAIVNVDGGSTDNTKQVFLRIKTHNPKIFISTPREKTGKGRVIRNLFEAGVELGATAVAMVDSDLKSITPQWIQYLTEPVFLGNDYVIPIYVRHKYDGTITNNITYPLTRALYGLRTRQPIAGDFGFSGKLARVFLTEKTWTDNVYLFGIDIWMTTIAIARGFKVCQTFLGAPKTHRTKDPASHLGPMFFQVVGTVFQLAVEFEYIWKDVSASMPTSIFGFGLGVKEEPPEVKVTRENLLNNFLKGADAYGDLWTRIISPLNLEDLQKLRGIAAEKVRVPADLWARILFDYIVAYRDELKDRTTLMNSLVPLYYARTLGYVNDIREMETKEAEEFLNEECRIIEGEKYYLIAKWNQTPRKDGIPSIAQYLLE